MAELNVLLIWLDGREERIQTTSARITDGALVIEIGRREYRHIPLVQLREWRVSE